MSTVFEATMVKLPGDMIREIEMVRADADLESFVHEAVVIGQ